MATVFLVSPSCSLSREGRHLRVSGGEATHRFPVEGIDEVIVMGRARVTVPALEFLTHEGVPVTWLSAHGRFLGRWQPPHSPHITRRHTQFVRMSDPEYALRFARGACWRSSPAW